MKTASKLALATFAFLSTGEAFALRELRSERCEVFVERAQTYRGSHHLTGVTLYLKTRNQDIEGKIVRVGFYAQQRNTFRGCSSDEETVRENCAPVAGWTVFPAVPFQGTAPDFWELKLTVTHNFTFPHQYEGAFFVETDKGLRYWANSPLANGNFFIDGLMAQNLETAQGRGWIYGSRFEDAIVTADEFPYLNPAGCR